MQSKTKIQRYRIYSIVIACAFFIASFLPQIAGAYAIQLSAPVILEFTKPSAPAQRIIMMHSNPSAHAKAIVTLGAIFPAKIMQTAIETPGVLLWSMYPASIRGRAFGGEGGDPRLNRRGGY